jgi:hypothetical protein
MDTTRSKMAALRLVHAAVRAVMATAVFYTLTRGITGSPPA